MRARASFAAVLLTAGLAGCGSVGAGPLAASAHATSAGVSSAAANVGSVYSTGLVTLANPTGDPLVLDAVELLGGQGGMVLVGAGIQRAPIEGVVGLDHGYPPAHTTPIASLRGAVIAPHERNVSVVVGAKAIRAGADSFGWIRLEYHVAGRHSHYRVDFPIGIQVCAIRRPVKHIHCPPPQLPGSK